MSMIVETSCSVPVVEVEGKEVKLSDDSVGVGVRSHGCYGHLIILGIPGAKAVTVNAAALRRAIQNCSGA